MLSRVHTRRKHGKLLE